MVVARYALHREDNHRQPERRYAMTVEGALRPDALRGKTIMVTGGGTGLGRAMATYFLRLGAQVVIASRKLDVLEASAGEMAADTGGEVLPVACDIRYSDQVDRLLANSLDRYGQVDALVNNAAGNFISPTERLSANAFATLIDIVLKGTANCTLALGKHWIAQKQAASVLNIVTTYAFTGSAYVVPSAAAKGGVLALTRSLDRKSTRLNSSHVKISYAVFCLKKKTTQTYTRASP